MIFLSGLNADATTAQNLGSVVGLGVGDDMGTDHSC